MKTWWNLLVGDPETFTPPNRTFNAINIVTFILVCVFCLIQYSVSAEPTNIIFLPGIAIQVILYYVSRFHRIYKWPIVVYGVASFLFIIGSYFLHGGLNGPILLLFFLSSHILIAFSKKHERIYMLLASIVAGVGVLIAEYYQPDAVQNIYHNKEQRFIETGAYYVICMVFIYIITIFLRNNYNRERKKALTRESELRVSEIKLRSQNETLSQIAFKQSHEFRGPLATIMQLMSLIKMEDGANRKEYIEMLDQAVKELDLKIREVVDMSNELRSAG